MNTIKQKINSNLAPFHFTAYCLTWIGHGCIISSVGPLIPYLSDLTGFLETQYSFLFFCRSIGFIVGAILLRYLEKYLSFHKILIYSSLFHLIFLTLFSITLDKFYQIILMFLISIITCFLEIVINVCVLQTQKNGEVEFWMLFAHGIYGIGCLLGPYLVYTFQVSSFAVYGIFLILIAPCYYFLKTPQDHNKIQLQANKQGFVQQIKNIAYSYPNSPTHNQKIQNIPKSIIINKKTQYLVCFMFFIYSSLQVGFGSWISSYAVLQQIATKQQATKYTSIFWISITILRFALPCFGYKSMVKLQFFSYLLSLFAVLSILLIFMGRLSLVCMIGSISFGLCISPMMPLLLAVPAQYNLALTSQQTGNFMISVAIGQGILSMAIGYSMEWFSNHMLFYLFAIFSVAFFMSNVYLKRFYLEQQVQQLQPMELKQIMIKKSQK